MKMKNNYTIKLQNMIDEVVENNPQIKFKTCNCCGKELPIHSLFYNKHPKMKDGFKNMCRECVNKKYNFSFEKEYDKLHTKKWYDGKEKEFKKLYRIMSVKELMQYYNVSQSAIRNMARKLGTTSANIDNYTKDEAIFIYENILNNKRLDFPDGFHKIYKYKIMLIEYLINDKLKWNRLDICNKWYTGI
jgi:hypothetical protein